MGSVIITNNRKIINDTDVKVIKSKDPNHYLLMIFLAGHLGNSRALNFVI